MLTGLESPTHIAVLVLVLLLVFGPKRLPEMGRSIGKGIRGFKQSLSDPTGAALTPPGDDGTTQPKQPPE